MQMSKKMNLERNMDNKLLEFIFYAVISAIGHYGMYGNLSQRLKELYDGGAIDKMICNY